MKAITLTQPWATLVAIGAKKIETRSWRTDYRGPLAIHAAKGKYNDEYLLQKIEPFYSALHAAGIVSRLQMPLGGVVAVCELVGVIPTAHFRESSPVYRRTGPDGRYYRYELTKDEMQFGDYTPGRYAWLLADVQALAVPVPAKGALGLWEWSAPELAHEA